jgi:hypothetical protein
MACNWCFRFACFDIHAGDYQGGVDIGWATQFFSAPRNGQGLFREVADQCRGSDALEILDCPKPADWQKEKSKYLLLWRRFPIVSLFVYRASENGANRVFLRRPGENLSSV